MGRIGDDGRTARDSAVRGGEGRRARGGELSAWARRPTDESARRICMRLHEKHHRGLGCGGLRQGPRRVTDGEMIGVRWDRQAMSQSGEERADCLMQLCQARVLGACQV